MSKTLTNSSNHQVCEVSVLLDCMRFNFGTIAGSELVISPIDSLHKSLDQEINWSRLLSIATEQQVIPMLYQTLKKFDHVPQSVMADLQKTNRLNGVKNISLAKELLRVLQVLENAGIEAIAFKGAALAMSVYGSLTMRQFSDIDLLVKNRDFARAKKILAGEGYISKLLPEVEIDFFERILQTPLISNHQAHYIIDLHWGLPPRRTSNPNHYDFLWECTVPLSIQSQTIKTLSPEVTLVFQSVNFARDRGEWRLLKPIGDLAQVVQFYPDLDWDLAIQIATRLRCQKLFILGVYIAHNLLNIDLPTQVKSMFTQVANLDVKIAIDNYLMNGDRQNISYKRSVSAFIMHNWFGYTYPFRTIDNSSSILSLVWINDNLFFIKLFLFSIFIRLCKEIKALLGLRG